MTLSSFILYFWSYRQYTGKEGGWSCEKGRVQMTKLGWNTKITNMTECTQEIGYLQSINTDKHLPQSPFTGKFFFNAGWLLWVLFFYGFSNTLARIGSSKLLLSFTVRPIFLTSEDVSHQKIMWDRTRSFRSVTHTWYNSKLSPISTQQ
jgi:hypothetical protein